MSELHELLEDARETERVSVEIARGRTGPISGRVDPLVVVVANMATTMRKLAERMAAQSERADPGDAP